MKIEKSPQFLGRVSVVEAERVLNPSWLLRLVNALNYRSVTVAVDLCRVQI